jgi:hypothetical protein
MGQISQGESVGSCIAASACRPARAPTASTADSSTEGDVVRSQPGGGLLRKATRDPESGSAPIPVNGDEGAPLTPVVVHASRPIEGAGPSSTSAP